MHALHLFQPIVNIMQHPILRRLDLNLLLAFDALLRHRSVSAAADELAMSPSALSHALARLRATLGDELLVRAGSGMQATAFAERMAEPLAAALELLARGLSDASAFDAASSERTFVFAATDYTAFAILPQLIAAVQRSAPRLRIKVVYTLGGEPAEDLAAGRIDFALGYENDPMQPLPGIESFDWLSDEYVVITCHKHPTIRGSLSLEQYLAARHVVVTPWNDASGTIDKALQRQGLQRDVAVQLPSVLAAPFIIARSRLIMTVPRLAAQTLQDSAPVAIYPAPFELPPYTLKVYHHVRHSGTAAHAWMRAQLLALAAR